jgi:hypothetical protein
MSNADNRLTAFAMIGNQFRQRREAYNELRENVQQLTDDEVEQLLTMCEDDDMRALVISIRKDG